MLALLSCAFAQDTHYWTNQYGTRAQLLGGVVVGSIADLSSTFYNPGAIALATDPTLVLSTDAMELTSITLENGAGPDKDLKNQRLAKAPSIFAFGLRPQGWKPWQLAFSFLTRYDANVEVDSRRVDSRDLIDSGASDRTIANELVYTHRINEVWVGVPSLATKITDRIGAGVTQYVAYRSQKQRFQAIFQAWRSDNEAAGANALDEFKYYNVRLLWKAGLSCDFRPLTFGIALTTPSLNLFGSGSGLLNTFVNDVDIDGDDVPDSELVSSYQDNLEARFESPLSIAAGASYDFGASALNASVEWFDNVDAFEVIQPQPFQAQSTGQIFSPRVAYAAKSVTNFGLGVQHTVHDKLAFYAGFTADHAAVDEETSTDVALATWDIRHLTFGSEFTVATIDLTLGMSYSYGADTASRLADLEQNSDFDDASQVNKITFSRLRFIFGLSVPL